MAIELVTGHAGQGHVSSADFGRFNAGICGTGKYVLATGQQFAYTVESVNEISIASGDAVDQGRHIIIPQNTSETAAIQNGTTGKTRIDVIALRYEKTTVTVDSEPVTIEGASLVVIKGTEVNTGSTPAIPAVTSGDIFNGASEDEMPLYHVLIEDTNITSVTKVFEVIGSLTTMADKIYPVGSIYMTVNNVDPGDLFGGTWEQIQGKFLLGASSGHAAGSSGGTETVTLTTAQLPEHSHSTPDHTHRMSAHAHTVPSHTHTASTSAAGAHTHNIRRQQTAASGTARFAIQGDDDVFRPTLSAGEHTHNVTVDPCGEFTTGAYIGGVNTESGGAGNTGNAGSGTAVDIMPPFLAVYVWKRTA